MVSEIPSSSPPDFRAAPFHAPEGSVAHGESGLARFKAEAGKQDRILVAELADGIAHDLNNVLAPLLMGIHLLKQKHVDKASQELLSAMEFSARRGAAIVHLFRFPQLTLNHGILLFDQTPTDTGLKFSVYDPNVPGQPTELTYHAAERAFYFPRNHYWAGGQASVVETYCSWFY